MSLSELQCVAEHHVPGSGALVIESLSSGLVNQTCRVLRGERAYAVRIAAPNGRDLGQDYAWEARVLDLAVRSGLAPPVEYCDPERGILISRWADGVPWTAAEVRQPDKILKVAALARRLHELPVPRPARQMTPQSWIERYGAALGRAGTALRLPDGAVSRALRHAAGKRLEELAPPPGGVALCHSDLHALNLVDDGTSLMLLDWEYAHASDPFWDLAGWCANNDLEEGPRHQLLADYLTRSPGADEWSRLRLLVSLYDYVCLLWSELYLALRGAAAPEVAARALKLEARLLSES